MKPYRQVGLYYSITAIAFAVNLLIYSFLIYYCHVNYLLAATVGFVVQNILDYLSERMWVFNKTHVRPVIGYARSLGVALTVLALILVLTYIGFQILRMDYLLARISAGLIAGMISFFLDKKITFVV